MTSSILIGDTLRNLVFSPLGMSHGSKASDFRSSKLYPWTDSVSEQIQIAEQSKVTEKGWDGLCFTERIFFPVNVDQV